MPRGRGTRKADPEGNATEQWIAQKDMQRFWKEMGTRLDEMATKKMIVQKHVMPSGNPINIGNHLTRIHFRKVIPIFFQ